MTHLHPGLRRVHLVVLVAIVALSLGLLSACAGGGEGEASVYRGATADRLTPAAGTGTPAGPGAASPDSSRSPVPATSNSAATTATSAGTPAPRPEPEPTEPPEPVFSTISEVVAAHGEPRGADFARLRIPVLGVDAPVRASIVGGPMTAPDNPVEVFWYDLSAYPGMGGAPGGGGNAVFSAHVDFAARVPYADARYRGLGVFGHLAVLSPGSVIEVLYQGETLRYQVVWRKQVSATAGDWGAIWSNEVPVDSITLYTCAGNFDSGTLSYDERVVVRAERV